MAIPLHGNLQAILDLKLKNLAVIGNELMNGIKLMALLEEFNICLLLLINNRPNLAGYIVLIALAASLEIFTSSHLHPSQLSVFDVSSGNRSSRDIDRHTRSLPRRATLCSLSVRTDDRTMIARQWLESQEEGVDDARIYRG
jgi:hypothetical protein